ncbi:MAG: flagellar biosynthesis anti-sigma factor FlgM [Desulfuromonadaceae bacterium]|nr:flagellar biosynthesis anti-sigma factor FlgM [Desulfuromonadaceae bacterium]
MTMKIQGDKSLYQQSDVRKVKKNADQSADAKSSVSDKISFSSVLQKAGQSQPLTSAASLPPLEGLRAPILATAEYVQDVSEGEELQRAARIEELKQQVADGTYAPDLKKVASSLLKFIAQG